MIGVTAALGAITAGLVFQRQSEPADGDASLRETARQTAVATAPVRIEERTR